MIDGLLVGRRALLVLLSAVLLASGCAGPGPRAGQTQPARPFEAATVAKLDEAITAALSAAGTPGVMVGVWSPQGDYVKAFGVADTATGAQMRDDFYSRIGSVTKTFTATAVLQLVERGQVGLDEPISTYLDGVPGGSAITVRQLATMRSGLPDYLQNPDFDNEVAADPVRTFSPPELLRWAFAEPAVFAPGSHYQYSNTNYILLGLLVEKVSGQPLADYLTEHILGPLGLTHTSFPAETQFPEPHATGYTDPVQTGGPPVDATDWTASFTWAAGAMISTLQDMRVWLPALATGTLLGPDLQKQRLESPPTAGLPPEVGYGIGVFTAAGWIGHNGSLPGYQTVAVYLPSRQMTMVVMVNTDITVAGKPQPSTAVAGAITAVLTPGNRYAV